MLTSFFSARIKASSTITESSILPYMYFALPHRKLFNTIHLETCQSIHMSGNRLMSSTSLLNSKSSSDSESSIKVINKKNNNIYKQNNKQNKISSNNDVNIIKWHNNKFVTSSHLLKDSQEEQEKELECENSVKQSTNNDSRFSILISKSNINNNNPNEKVVNKANNNQKSLLTSRKYEELEERGNISSIRKNETNICQKLLKRKNRKKRNKINSKRKTGVAVNAVVHENSNDVEEDNELEEMETILEDDVNANNITNDKEQNVDLNLNDENNYENNLSNKRKKRSKSSVSFTKMSPKSKNLNGKHFASKMENNNDNNEIQDNVNDDNSNDKESNNDDDDDNDSNIESTSNNVHSKLLVDNFPELAAEYKAAINSTATTTTTTEANANNALPVEIVEITSAAVASWRCPDCLQVWQCGVFVRCTLRNLCPHCNSVQKTCLANLYPELAKLWDHAQNDPFLTPDNIHADSKTSVYWICPVCNQSYLAKVRDKVNDKTKCPNCSAAEKTHTADWQHLHSLLLQEWHPLKNGDLRLDEVHREDSKTKLWWLCSLCGHEWQASAAIRCSSIRRHGNVCPACHGRELLTESKIL